MMLKSGDVVMALKEIERSDHAAYIKKGEECKVNYQQGGLLTVWSPDMPLHGRPSKLVSDVPMEWFLHLELKPLSEELEVDGIIYNKKCSECGVNLPLATVRSKEKKIICNSCYYPGIPDYSEGIATGYYHVDDDMSGGSGSWDNIVKMYENQ